MRSGYVDSFGRALLNRGSEDVDILASKHTPFASVRIDRCNRYGLSRQAPMDESYEPEVVLRRSPLGRLSQRLMNRRQYDLESGREERHGVFADSGALRKVIGLSSKRSTYRFFGDGGRYDGVDATCKRLVACGIKVGDRAGAG